MKNECKHVMFELKGTKHGTFYIPYCTAGNTKFREDNNLSILKIRIANKGIHPCPLTNRCPYQGWKNEKC
jgi:hypothetical protein